MTSLGSNPLSRVAITTFVLSLSFAGSSVADPLNLMPHTPDITSNSISVSYNASTDMFIANGYAVTLDFDGIAPPDYDFDSPGIFSLSAKINSLGELESGDFTITGVISTYGATGPDLLLGTISQFGFTGPPGNDIFEFIVNITGGDLSAQFTSQVGIILDLSGSTFDGSFGGDFVNFDSGVADTFAMAPVPEPATVGILMTILLVAGGWQLKRRLPFGVS